MAVFSEAKWYDENSPSQKEDGLKLLALADPKNGDKILDFGCGTGNLSILLAEFVGPEGRVVGIDPDEERLQFAREKYPASNLEYVQGSAKEIPGNNYDIIFSNHALHYCVDKAAVFKQFAAKLKKGGKLTYIACIEDDVRKNIQSLPDLYGPKFRNAYANWFNYTSKDEFLRTTVAHDFKIEHSEVIVVKYSFNGVDDLVDFHKTHIRGEYDDSEFKVDAMKRHYGNGPFHINYDYLLVVATLS